MRVLNLPESADVVVVGAGPTGLTAAGVLAQRGRDVLVLDDTDAPDHTSRAAVVHAGTLRALEELGVSDALVDSGLPVTASSLRDRGTVLGRLDFGSLPGSHPYVVMIPQWRTEEILADRLHDLGTQVHRPWSVRSVTRRPDGYVVDVASGEHEHSIRTRYLIGADGVHSTVRESLGIEFQGAGYDDDFVLADVEIDWELPHDEVMLFFSPGGLLVNAPLPGERHRLVATVADAPEEPDLEFVQRLVSERGPRSGARVRALHWSSQFHLQHRVADRLHLDSALLAGDAAHAHSPAGGQGMNIGIQDAVAAAVAVDAALDGREEALADYGAQRHPVAADVVRLTDRLTRMATLESAPMRLARNAGIVAMMRIPSFRRALMMAISELKYPDPREHRPAVG
jgi:2-polyprenyl-6-methoxyphenol hydroxylase-like FAD-dependent oxidoreductase